MEKSEHLAFLKEKYLQLSRDYLKQLQEGKTTEQLKDLSDVIKVLVREMEQLEGTG